MIHPSLVEVYTGLLVSSAKVVNSESGTSRKTGEDWTVIYISWREIIKKGAFSRDIESNKEMSKIKKFAVEFRQDTDDIKYTRML